MPCEAHGEYKEATPQCHFSFSCSHLVSHVFQTVFSLQVPIYSPMSLNISVCPGCVLLLYCFVFHRQCILLSSSFIYILSLLISTGLTELFSECRKHIIITVINTREALLCVMHCAKHFSVHGLIYSSQRNPDETWRG